MSINSPEEFPKGAEPLDYWTGDLPCLNCHHPLGEHLENYKMYLDEDCDDPYPGSPCSVREDGEDCDCKDFV